MAVSSNGIIISQLAQASDLNNSNIMPVVQEGMSLGVAVKETKKTTLGAIKSFFLDAIPAWAKAAQKPTYTAAEVGAATPLEVTNAANSALNSAKAYTDGKVSAEEQARIQGDANAKAYTDGKVNELENTFAYALSVIKNIFANCGCSTPLITDSGERLITETGDRLLATLHGCCSWPARLLLITDSGERLITETSDYFVAEI